MLHKQRNSSYDIMQVQYNDTVIIVQYAVLLHYRGKTHGRMTTSCKSTRVSMRSRNGTCRVFLVIHNTVYSTVVQENYTIYTLYIYTLYK